jgi:hypothetical protein
MFGRMIVDQEAVMSEHADLKSDGTILSRRQAILGALALAAGSLVVTRPDTASAAVGDVMRVGDALLTDGPTTITRTSDGTGLGTPISYAAFNGSMGGGTAWGVRGTAGTGSSPEGAGIWGDGHAAHVYGVRADHHADGTALRVNGKASFSRSGYDSVPKRHSTKTVTVASGVNSGSMFLVTLQGSGGSGVYLKYATLASATTFKVVLNKKATKTVRFAWMIVD